MRSMLIRCRSIMSLPARTQVEDLGDSDDERCTNQPSSAAAEGPAELEQKDAAPSSSSQPVQRLQYDFFDNPANFSQLSDRWSQRALAESRESRWMRHALYPFMVGLGIQSSPFPTLMYTPPPSPPLRSSMVVHYALPRGSHIYIYMGTKKF